MTLYQIAEDRSRRLNVLFLRGQNGRRPANRGHGAGLGESHQTGWTAVVARGVHLFATTAAEQAREVGKTAAAVEIERR